MITKPKIRRFNLRPEFSAALAAKAARQATRVVSSALEGKQAANKPDPSAPRPLPNAQEAAAMNAQQPAETELDAIRSEGLSGRQLRLARRVAQKHNLPATSDFDAVRLLRKAGIDPFEKASLLDLVSGDASVPQPQSRALTTVPTDPKLPQTVNRSCPLRPMCGPIKAMRQMC